MNNQVLRPAGEFIRRAPRQHIRSSSRRRLCTTCKTPLRAQSVSRSFANQQRSDHDRTACCIPPTTIFQKRNFATVNESTSFAPRRGLDTNGRVRSLADIFTQESPTTHGPIQEYDARVAAGKLRDDAHQRTLIQSLQDLHEMLAGYDPPPVERPSLEDLRIEEAPKQSWFSFFSPAKTPSKKAAMVPANLPQGLYMYGDVGSGKTMLMDLFYDTLPPNIQHKTRIHFHNFMQDVHKRLHKIRLTHGNSLDGIPLVAADIAENASVLCFDEFQCTDVADAMILRRLVESLMANGSVIVTTSNRHPNDLYKNGIQRESFIPCIKLLQTALKVLNLDSTTDYRKIPRPPSGVYHHPLDKSAATHVDRWFRFLGDFEADPPHPATQRVWGRDIQVPAASGRACHFSFQELIGRATGAADYIELVRAYDAFIVTDVPGMTLRERDWARRFITFIDAVYEGRAKLVLTTAVPLAQLFLSRKEMNDVLEDTKQGTAKSSKAHVEADKMQKADDHSDLDSSMRMLMDDLGLSMDMLRSSSIFSGDEEAFAFARALSRLQEMGSQEWVERGMGLEEKGGLVEKEGWQKERESVLNGNASSV